MNSISLTRYFAAIAILLAAGSTAHGFGTVSVAGQNAEHERITRRALACDVGGHVEDCFQAETLDILAGKKLSFGAVGAPDNPAVGLLTTPQAHCDGGDFLNVPGYPQSQADAQKMLVACRAWMKQHFDAAIASARNLVSAKGKISRWQTSITPSCVFAGRVAGRAKCTVLENFGVVLHASQDFYSHTNWTDKAPAGAPNAEVPPGLGHDTPAPWLDLRTMQAKIPTGLISGCFESASIPFEDRGCNYGAEGKVHRVKHAALNKDKGSIDEAIGTGTTPRGKVDDNFHRAVQAAVDDTRDKWAALQEGLIKAYGAARAKKMICVLTHDDAASDCAT